MNYKPKLVTAIVTILFSFVVTSVVWADCDENPVVTITPSSPTCVAQEFCAATTLCGEAVAGSYTWEATGGIANTTSGECIPVTPSGASSFTVTVTDTANGNTQDSVTGECITTAIGATFSGCGRPFGLWFGAVLIEGNGIEFARTSIVQYDSPLVIKLPMLLSQSDNTITQFVFLWPGAVFFPEWAYPATVTVTVDGLSATFFIPPCG